jgi:hypothetical protein
LFCLQHPWCRHSAKERITARITEWPSETPLHAFVTITIGAIGTLAALLFLGAFLAACIVLTFWALTCTFFGLPL